MFRIFFFTIILSFNAYSGTCLNGLGGAVEMYAEDEGIPKESLEADTIQTESMEIFRIKNLDSCGINGCDFSLYVTDKDKCVVRSFTTFNAKLSSVSKDWTRLTVLTKTLGVDGAQTYKKSYVFNPETLKFEEKKLK